MVIDFHTHAFPDHLAPRAMESLAKAADLPYYFDGTVSGLKESMQKAGISHSVLCNIAVKPSQAGKIAEFATRLLVEKTVNGHEPVVIPLASVHPFDPEWRQWLCRFKELGFAGIKLHPEYQKFYVDDPRMEPFYRELARLGLIVVFHAGEDEGVPPPVHATPRHFANILPLLEDGCAVLAHMGGYNLYDEVLELLCGKRVYLDTSMALRRMDQETARKIFRTHGPERILFATDAPWDDQNHALVFFRDSFAPGFLSSEDQERVLWRNGASLLGLKNGPAIQIRPAQDQIEIVRKLFVEYAAELDIDLSFQQFEQELQNLPGDYAPPRGCIYVGWLDTDPVGCVALRAHEDMGCELKRLYLRPQYRGKGYSRALLAQAVSGARAAGYPAIFLDTLPDMDRAQALYRSMGFVETTPYRHNPIPGAVYMCLRL